MWRRTTWQSFPHSQATILHIIIPSWQLTVSMHQIGSLICNEHGKLMVKMTILFLLCRHKPKVWYSSMASSLSDYQHFYHDILQNHRGRPPPRQVWVFGICDTSHTPARGVMRIVPDRSAATLLPIIPQHVRSGTIVHSDEWAVYNRVQHLPSVGQHHR